MQVTYCDKCGEEINNNPLANAKFPFVSITLQYSINMSRSVDLCSSCKDKFLEWLKDKEKGE